MSDPEAVWATRQALSDADWIYFGLQQDAALVTSLVLQGRSVEADAHLEASGYRARLAEWQRLTGKPVTAA